MKQTYQYQQNYIAKEKNPSGSILICPFSSRNHPWYSEEVCQQLVNMVVFASPLAEKRQACSQSMHTHTTPAAQLHISSRSSNCEFAAGYS